MPFNGARKYAPGPFRRDRIRPSLRQFLTPGRARCRSDAHPLPRKAPQAPQALRKADHTVPRKSPCALPGPALPPASPHTLHIQDNADSHASQGPQDLDDRSNPHDSQEPHNREDHPLDEVTPRALALDDDHSSACESSAMSTSPRHAITINTRSFILRSSHKFPATPAFSAPATSTTQPLSPLPTRRRCTATRA